MDHKIYPHGKLEQLADGVWWVKGGLGFPLHRNMTVLKLPSGELLLHSVVALDEAGMKSLDALGKPAYAIVPHPQHQMDIAFYKDRYPDLKVLAPAVHKDKIRVPVAGTVEDVLPGLGFKLYPVPETRTPEYAFSWTLPGGGTALVINDALGGPNTADESKLMGRLVMRHTGVPGNTFGIARLYRTVMSKDVSALKRFAGELAAIPDLRLITVSHGDPVTRNAAQALLAAAGS